MYKGRGKGCALVGEVAVREPTCVGNGVTELGCHSSPPPSPSHALKRAEYPFPAVCKLGP